MKPLAPIKLLQISFLALLSFTLLLHTTLSYTTLLSSHLPLILSCALCALLLLLHHLLHRPRPVLLLNYSCYKPPPHRQCTLDVAESFVLKGAHFTQPTIDFMRNIYLKSGLGNQTYAPPFIFTPEQNPTLKCAIQEAEEGMFTSIDSVLSKTLIDPHRITMLIVTCGSFSPSPSLSSLIVNHYNLSPQIKTYNLSGMGCSSGIIAIDLAAKILQSTKNDEMALVVISENITLNWYAGANRSMLVTNCIFRVGCTAAILTNDGRRRRSAKMELAHSLRTHHGADDSAYRAAFQEEDSDGITGISLTKDLIRIAGVNLRQHIKILAPKVLPVSQLIQYLFLAAKSIYSGESKSPVPDFTTAFGHMCIHTGGKAVIEQVGRVLRLGESVTEPARMTLNRFGNTSSSLVFYELAYFEAKMRVKRNDRMWMIAFGTGFKVGSLVWKWIADSSLELDNPWIDCIDEYPLKVW